jgi:hypothetical protein
MSAEAPSRGETIALVVICVVTVVLAVLAGLYVFGITT